MKQYGTSEDPACASRARAAGKTTVITKRIEYLIRDEKISPSNILVITFTKAAANEMKERFFAMMKGEGRGVTFGTFHAVFFMILKHAYHYNASDIIREEERMRLMRDIMRSMRLDYEDEAEFAGNLLSEISFVKNGRIDLANYYPMNCGKDVFSNIFSEYGRYLKRHRKIDFDDMLVYTYELFSERKDILAAWQDKYRYILIDEFQDVNQIQYDIARMLAGPRQNLFIVGDDDQSIYRFRGARPEIMLHMPKDYPNAKIVCLSYNYRCPKEIVRMAGRVIANNKERFPKEIISAGEEGHAVTAELFETQREAGLKIIERIRAGKFPLSQTAVLFRTNMQARIMTELLAEYNIPFLAKDRAPNIYEHWLAKDLYAYMRLAEGSMSRRDFLLIMNRPKRYLSRESLDGETVSFDAWQSFYSEQPWIERRIEKLREDLRAIRAMRPFAAINYIRKAIGYDEFVTEYAESRNIDAEGLFEILDALQDGSRPYDSFGAWRKHIEQYKRAMEKAYSEKQRETEAVTLATFHGAKGLEFDAVHIPDVNEGVMPYKKAVLPADMEEERRMFYVGITRAKKRLYLYSAKKIGNKEAEISRFLIEARESQASSNSASSSNSSNLSSTASYSSSL